MKKLSIVLLAFLFIGITNINAQTETDVTTEISEVEQFKANCPDWGTDKCPYTINEDGKLVCVKTGKICNATCKNKAKGTCCKGKRKCSKGKSKYSKSKSGGFNFNKNNNYGGGKSSCSKKAKKGCCKKKPCCKGGDNCKKPCCVPPPTIEKTTPKDFSEPFSIYQIVAHFLRSD